MAPETFVSRAIVIGRSGRKLSAERREERQSTEQVRCVAEEVGDERELAREFSAGHVLTPVEDETSVV